MRILYVSQYFPPEMGAPAARVSELARLWHDAGHHVTVLTAFPNHPTGVIHPDYRSRFRRGFVTEDWDGVKVVRSWLWPLPNRRPRERVLNYMSFAISAGLRGLLVGRPDVVIGSSPQLLVGLAAWWIGRLRRLPFVFEVRDLWPEAILAAGVGRENTLFARTLTRVSRFLYKRADHIVVVSPAFVPDLLAAGVDRSRISIVPNGVDVELFAPGEAPEWRDRLGPRDAFVVSFVGTIGLAHGLALVLGAAARLKEKAPEVVFVLAGEGTERADLENQATENGLTNVRFLGELPRGDVPQLLRASDCALVLLKRAPAYEKVIPSKLLESMAAGLPIILGVEGQARAILNDAGAGVAITPENAGELENAVLGLHTDETGRKTFGEAGRAFVAAHYNRSDTARDYVEILGRVINGERGEPG